LKPGTELKANRFQDGDKRVKATKLEEEGDVWSGGRSLQIGDSGPSRGHQGDVKK